jgi:phosphatidylserine/phosphatidylglycerophosphate/cardiolipin synthase-like enzyme
MRFTFITILCVYAALSGTAQAFFFDDDTQSEQTASAGASFEPVFSSSGVPSAAVEKAILSAKKSIRISARKFTSKPVAEAIVKALRAGIDIEIVLDSQTNQNIDSAGPFLMKMNFTPHITKGENSIYEGYIVIDEKDIVLGNFAALPDEVEEKKNADSVLVIHNAPELAQKYLTNWQTLWEDSEAMKKPMD